MITGAGIGAVQGAVNDAFPGGRKKKPGILKSALIGAGIAGAAYGGRKGFRSLRGRRG